MKSFVFLDISYSATETILEEPEDENDFETIELTDAQQEMANAILELKKSFKEPIRKKGPLSQRATGPSVTLRTDLRPLEEGSQNANGLQGGYR